MWSNKSLHPTAYLLVVGGGVTFSHCSKLIPSVRGSG
jgi:hypothetical protein